MTRRPFIILFVLMTICQLSLSQDRSSRERMELYNSVEDASEILPGEDVDEKIRKNFVLRAEVSKKECYVGEPIMATFKAYSRLDASSQVIKRPSLSGFSVIEMVDAYNNQPEVEKLNGEYFYMHLIRKVQLFPLQAGNFTLEPAEVESVIHLRKTDESGRVLRNLRGLFRKDRNDPSLQRELVFKTPEVEIKVNPLPEEGQPENFAGAVGNFTAELIIEDSIASQHEPSNITLLIRGSGNFPLITDPEIQWPAGVNVSAPVVNDEVNKYEHPLSGVKTFRFSVDNSVAGSFTIPPVSFSFFDPSSKTYRTVNTKPLTYTVEAGERSRKFLPKIAGENSGGWPMHYYYFGVVALVVVAVIVYIFTRKPRKN